MTLYEYLPTDIQETVDGFVEELETLPWSARLHFLIGVLVDNLEGRAAAEPWLLIQQWTGIVTAILEKLKVDSGVPECVALMSISLDDQWRAQALGQIERDPAVLDYLAVSYPAWGEIVDSVLEADQRHPIKAA